MRNNFTVLVIALSLKAAASQAQVPNGGFEHLNADGTISNWGNVYLVPMSVDSNGISSFDSIVYDNQFYAPTNDANGGSTALELRNAWDFTTNTGIAGAVASDDDSVFSSWGLLNLVPTYATPFTPFMPFNFGFSYKFFPVNGDSAFAEIILWDSSGYEVGRGTFIITAPASSYTFDYAPINYSMPGLAAFYSYSFSTFYSASPGSHEPSFGTRLLVDNLGFNYASVAGINTISNDKQFQVYPNPASNQINVRTQVNKSFPYKIYNMFGQMVGEGTLQPYMHSVTLDNFESGVFNIVIYTGEVREQHRFIVSK